MTELSCEDVDKEYTVNSQKRMGIVRAHERYEHRRVGQNDPQHAECPQPVKTRQSGRVLVGCKERRRASTCECIEVT